ncbi:hypothetical protein BAZSYMA_ACONTIG190953_3 [Bathymodiolus azoricus thioautotrophic gill symbiont]|uniref:Uncharacterized protein n=1 Tax=Bathymodiolus azoricus thioautotrophic gill symbiont TaxID=235205 RepID=A0A1H6K9E0_9GAMM|nr:hypothetical protein BAZSYMA_ACONTIG190953_3 [Bathymodiolus azoricus thioautotrophic gill symbiont]
MLLVLQSALIMLMLLLELPLHLLPSLIQVMLLFITQFLLLSPMAYPLMQEMEPSLERQFLHLIQ